MKFSLSKESSSSIDFFHQIRSFSIIFLYLWWRNQTRCSHAKRQWPTYIDATRQPFSNWKKADWRKELSRLNRFLTMSSWLILIWRISSIRPLCPWLIFMSRCGSTPMHLGIIGRLCESSPISQWALSNKVCLISANSTKKGLIRSLQSCWRC